MPTAVLVTGAAGLIGRRVVELLIEAGRPVVACDRVTPPDPASYATVLAELSDTHRLNDIVEQAAVEGIIHCGGVSGPVVGRDHPAGTATANIGGTVNLLEIARQRRLGRFVYCSSIAAYGHTPAGLDPVDAGAPLAATDIYGASKAAADLMVRAYARDYGVDAVALRIGFVFGPRRRTASFLSTALRDALDGRPTAVPEDGARMMQMVYVDDVATAVIAAYDAADIAPRAFNVTSGTRVELRELARLVAQRLPQARINFGTLVDIESNRQALFNISDTERRLGWRPSVDLAEGIARYADWLRRNPF
jgi:nucleoside-diphosphate-sugar epimerase